MSREADGGYPSEADRRMALAREWDSLVERVRGHGFEDFLRPPRLDALISGVRQGPVVVVNVSTLRCDALIVGPEGVRPVELPLTADEVMRRTVAYLNALRGDGQVAGLSFVEELEAEAEARKQRETVLRETVEWLWDAVAEPVFAELGITESSAEPERRLWWCPTGLLTLLPLHGAGYHFDGSRRTVIDRVIPSYTPTVRALGLSRPSRDERGVTSPLLFVGAPDHQDQVALREEVTRERDFLRRCYPGGVTLREGTDATVGAVQQDIVGHRRVHLSCHGRQDVNDPSRAGFMLSDGLLTIVRLAESRFEGDFAFLSACRTATGGLHLPDEVITLAAAMNYGGFRNVVATAWSIDSTVAAEVTKAFYLRSIVGGVFFPERSAQMLHAVVRDMRDGGRPLEVWLPFTHTGS
ncbi:CHAT domain-containing protein [Lentzea sp. NEAU-D7]|uniref:CHAT domain-containing protein n=1 Tax=Lentzea sp. NEAU-D7 TaxID=2994667 RepID=UPI00224B7BDA|nr:CHAT domain-containing protein [Lentzea sp. NEAU-D7]MCX2950169.1 CHAT domain-containing protein [Lentzea sp. NEAU-D7]